MRQANILIADDDSVMRDSLKKILKSNNRFGVTVCCDGEDALAKIKESSFDLAITDLKMPRMDGLELVRRIKERSPHTIVVVMTAYATVETAVAAMKNGAYDYMTKPFSADELELVIEKALEHNRALAENMYLREEISSEYNFGIIVGRSQKMQEIYDVVRKVSQTDATVLVMGESGTGKELVARAIHYNSRRSPGPFIKVNCAALTSNLLESELFGHEKGAFTNAFYKKPGRFELADKGTLLLDEISEMDISLQAKLLRVLQEGEFDRVGGITTVKTDARIISTTNRDLPVAIREGKFREDLFYRLNVVPIALPPLRQRKEDIPMLVKHFLDKFNKKNGKKIVSVNSAVLDMFRGYHWPGNVRELESAIERAFVLSSSEVLDASLFSLPAGASSHSAAVPDAGRGGITPLYEVEKKAIMDALDKYGTNRTQVANALGITPRTLRNKLKLFESEKSIPRESFAQNDRVPA
jgi:two-component system, NtrC family, response regulator AtoC